jgi:PPM family protein phosphatase
MSATSVPDAVAICFAGQCDRGKVRAENQDSIASCATPLGDLLVLADGIGGFEGGGVASRLAVEAFSASLADMPAFFPPAIAIQEAASRANAEIAAAAAEPDTPNSRMGTTVVAALLQQDPYQPAAVQAWIGHIGDSRAYVVHEGRLSRITRDHSAVQLLLDHNLIAPEEARDHPDASVLTRTLGREPNVEIELDSIALQPGDSLLLCSDGLWGYVPEPEIERVLADPALSAEDASRALLDLALDAGGHDNVSVQIARLAGASDAAAPPVRANARESAWAPQSQPALEPALLSLSAPIPELAVDLVAEPVVDSPVEPLVEPEPEPFLAEESARIAACILNPVLEPAPASVPYPEPLLAPEVKPEPGPAFLSRSAPIPELAVDLVAKPVVDPPVEPLVEPEPEPFLAEESARIAACILNPVLEPAPASVPYPEPLFAPEVKPEPEPPVPAELRIESASAFTLEFPLAEEAESVPAQEADRPRKFAGLRARISAVLKFLADTLVSFAFPGDRKSEPAPTLESESAPNSKRGESRISMSIELFTSLMLEFKSPLERASERDPGLAGDSAPRVEIVEGQVSQVSLFLNLLGLLLVGFGTSCGLVYFAVLENWFGVDALLR